MLFYQIGELFQSFAVGKSRKNITALMDIRPDYANIIVDGKLEQVDPDDVEMLEDLVMAATNEALRMAEDANAEVMNKMTGGLGGGLPF